MNNKELIATHALTVARDACNQLAAYMDRVVPQPVPPLSVTTWAELAQICDGAIEALKEEDPLLAATCTFRQRARVAIINDEKYLNLEDCRKALGDPQFLADVMTLMRVALDNKSGPVQSVGVAFAGALYHLAGEHIGRKPNDTN